MRKFWDKVTLKWEFGQGGVLTSLDFEGNLDASASGRDDKLHRIRAISAWSLPQENDYRRLGEMELLVGECFVGKRFPPKSDRIIELCKARFQEMVDGGSLYGMPQMEAETWGGKFSIKFQMGTGEQFCDAAIEIARAIFVGLGVHDTKGYRLAWFSVTRETFAPLDGAWITFPRWLRMKHQLPIYGPEDND